MTADDFFLLFIAFGAFVVMPALLFWGFARIADRREGTTQGPDIRPDIGSPDAPSGGHRQQAARAGSPNDYPTRRVMAWRDRMLPAGLEG